MDIGDGGEREEQKGLNMTPCNRVHQNYTHDKLEWIHSQE